METTVKFESTSLNTFRLIVFFYILLYETIGSTILLIDTYNYVICKFKSI